MKQRGIPSCRSIADAVERARDRIGRNDWPPTVAIRQISDLLAVNLYQKN